MSNAGTVWSIRNVEPADAEAWADLYAGYREFYRLSEDATVVATTWRWTLDGEHGMRGLVAVHNDGTIGALANLRTFARPSSGTIGLYLDDLFTSTRHRGNGLASLLLDRAAIVAGEVGASVVRWITADDNATARSVYDTKATATSWVTYDMRPKI